MPGPVCDAGLWGQEEEGREGGRGGCWEEQQPKKPDHTVCGSQDIHCLDLAGCLHACGPSHPPSLPRPVLHPVPPPSSLADCIACHLSLMSQIKSPWVSPACPPSLPLAFPQFPPTFLAAVRTFPSTRRRMVSKSSSWMAL